MARTLPARDAGRTARTGPAGADLLRAPLLGRLLRWRHGRAALQWPLLLLALLVLYDGLVGPSLAPKNLAGVLPWVHWRGFLVLGLLLFGNWFCMACPFMLPRRLAKRLLGGARPWPARLANKWVTLAVLATFFWLYEAFDLWASPWLSAWVVAAYLLAAFVIDGFFRGAAFCKYVCPIGAFNHVSSMISPAEVTMRDPAACARCTTFDCLRGRHDALGALAQPGCDLYLFLPKKAGNLDCTFCLDCARACPHDNVAIVPRHALRRELAADPPRAGIGRLGARRDLAALALVVVFGGFVNAFGMVPPVYDLEQWVAERTGITSEPLVLALLFVLGLGALPALLLGSAAWAGRALTGGREPLADIVTCHAFALVPLGFGLWFAHYSFHFLTGVLAIVPLAQAFAADVGIPLGTPDWSHAALLPEGWVSRVESAALGFGFVATGAAILTMARARHPQQGSQRREALPWIVAAALLLVAALWLMAQPMDMRGVVLG